MLVRRISKLLTTPVMLACVVNAKNAARGSHKRPIKTIRQIKSQIVDLMGLPKGFTIVPPDRSNLLRTLPTDKAELPARRMKDSYSTALLPLSSDLKLQNKYINMEGYARVGRILEDMDVFAVWVALKYISNPKQPPGSATPYVMVTAAVNDVNFFNRSIFASSDIRINGRVTWVGRSSMEVFVWLDQEVGPSWKRVIEASFIMVARNSTNTASAPVNKLVPAGPDEEQEYNKALKRYEDRKIKVVNYSLANIVPSTNEQLLIHNLFTKGMKNSKSSEGLPLLAPNMAWISDTQMGKAIFPHPENRNHHNKVFGGFLMRSAVELAWSIGYVFSQRRPKIVYMSDVSFKRGVSLGEVIVMSGKVIYTKDNYIVVTVTARVVSPKSATKTAETNTFFMIFDCQKSVLEVLPSTYPEAMQLIVGRRKFDEFQKKSTI